MVGGDRDGVGDDISIWMSCPLRLMLAKSSVSGWRRGDGGRDRKREGKEGKEGKEKETGCIQTRKLAVGE